MKAIGKMIYNMDQERRCGQTSQSTKEIIMKERNMARDCMCGQTAARTTVTGLRIESKAMAHTPGLMEGSLRGNGRIITCTVTESIHGVTAESMKDTTKWIKNMAMVYTSGQMDVVMKVTGLQENNMVKVNMFCLMEQFV